MNQDAKTTTLRMIPYGIYVHIVVGEITEAHLPTEIAGRPDAAILEMKDLGDKLFYGG
jgi:hypothetical protein